MCAIRPILTLPWRREYIEYLERDIGVPVVSSALATFWNCFKALEIHEPIRGYGKQGQRLVRTPGRFVARSDLALEQSAALKEIKMAPVNPALAEKLDEYARQLRAIFGN